jgi:trehalose-phosphatase
MNILQAIRRKREIKSRIKQAPHLFFSLDFDGTLAPIVDRPERAVLPGATRNTLTELRDTSDITVAIVSGRSLKDISARLGIEGFIYSGNHGLEISGPGVQFLHPQAAALRAVLAEITERVALRATSLPGVEVEAKQLSTSVHFRRASAFARRELLYILRESPLSQEAPFVVHEGKKVYEIRPRVSWNKGEALRWIRDHLLLSKALPIVLGDDLTDEDAFGAFDDAISVCVAPRHETSASYTLADTGEVRVFLAAIAAMWRRRPEAADPHGSSSKPSEPRMFSPAPSPAETSKNCEGTQ